MRQTQSDVVLFMGKQQNEVEKINKQAKATSISELMKQNRCEINRAKLKLVHIKNNLPDYLKGKRLNNGATISRYLSAQNKLYEIRNLL